MAKVIAAVFAMIVFLLFCVLIATGLTWGILIIVNEGVRTMSKRPDYLTLCSIAAQKAGTSYGKYMAIHTDTTRQFRPMRRTWKPRRAFPKSAPSAGRNSRRARSSRKSIAVWSARKPTPREPLKGDTAIEKIRNWRYMNSGRTGSQI